MVDLSGEGVGGLVVVGIFGVIFLVIPITLGSIHSGTRMSTVLAVTMFARMQGQPTAIS